jgi:hypothetical protein
MQATETLLLHPKFGNLKAVVNELIRRGKNTSQHKNDVQVGQTYCKRLGRPIKIIISKLGKHLLTNGLLQRLALCGANQNRKWGIVMYAD